MRQLIAMVAQSVEHPCKGLGLVQYYWHGFESWPVEKPYSCHLGDTEVSLRLGKNVSEKNGKETKMMKDRS